ncbi:hypothetical protein T484DRAFT_1752556 [Baffinella frigidus]|nr:hypothetical protein T484DRAFT_1752556 [Cryptophyta sp. CCMP2293]
MDALATSMDHHRMLSHSRQAVSRRLLSSLPSALRKNEPTDESQAMRARTLEPTVLLSQRRPSVLLPQRRPCPLCVIYREIFEKGKSPAKAWSVLGKRFKVVGETSSSASALSLATTDGAASPQEASSPLFARCSSEPPRLLTPIVSPSKEHHVHHHDSCYEQGHTRTLACRRFLSDPSHNTAQPRDESTAPTRGAGHDVKLQDNLNPRVQRGVASSQRITQGDALRASVLSGPRARLVRPASAEAPIAPAAFVAQWFNSTK